MKAKIGGVSYVLPQIKLTNADLVRDYADWTVDKIAEKTGIDQRYIAAEGECASDLGIQAAEELFATGIASAADIDYLLFCTQSPDYFLPTSACIIQNRLGLRTAVGALDFNLGCSGYVYGLGLAKGLIETAQAATVLLITAETYSKFIHPGDRSVRTLFGDAATATLITTVPDDTEMIGPFIYGTDGAGARNLMVPAGGARQRSSAQTTVVSEDDQGNLRALDNLYMNGSEIFGFTLSSVPKAVKALLDKAGESIDTVDLFVFHQANRFMLEHLRKKCQIPQEKFVLAYQRFGNTVSCTIPIALKEAERSGQLRRGMRVMLVGFGVGYSWGGCFVEW
ncbi:3-oxoacyl-ACP synthase III family protein [Candidatus Thiodictyon syntrophicum]|uniref:3-oxoacyl-ACP synthase n=1 Tax=Candidatus Thiodictyon syntrophicum TaxID=1166950 RepID=A0A2K8UD61_9GAMM|nr:ketoacyl-ACP synthase III [Candidatus Thiodictyon syntrophicum]AUB83523.1 3-oxoacyl-ACP synthase [Candidatus Thiodictyon syntrophicum]